MFGRKKYICDKCGANNKKFDLYHVGWEKGNIDRLSIVFDNIINSMPGIPKAEYDKYSKKGTNYCTSCVINVYRSEEKKDKIKKREKNIIEKEKFYEVIGLKPAHEKIKELTNQLYGAKIQETAAKKDLNLSIKKVQDLEKEVKKRKAVSPIGVDNNSFVIVTNGKAAGTKIYKKGELQKMTDIELNISTKKGVPDFLRYNIIDEFGVKHIDVGKMPVLHHGERIVSPDTNGEHIVINANINSPKDFENALTDYIDKKNGDIIFR